MARFSRLDVALTMRNSGMLPLYFSSDLSGCKSVLKACYAGGVRIFEFTNRGDFAHELFGQLVRYAEQELPEMILGVGSVVDAGTTSLYIQSGANFVVSPILHEDMAKVCNRRKILWAPGCGSLSEINKAEELGAEICKIFPASQVGGPAFIKAVKAPCPWSSIMPTGGVTPQKENLTKWFEAGATCVGLGSQLITRSIIQNEKWEELTTLCRETLETIAQLKQKYHA